MKINIFTFILIFGSNYASCSQRTPKITFADQPIHLQNKQPFDASTTQKNYVKACKFYSFLRETTTLNDFAPNEEEEEVLKQIKSEDLSMDNLWSSWQKSIIIADIIFLKKHYTTIRHLSILLKTKHHFLSQESAIKNEEQRQRYRLAKIETEERAFIKNAFSLHLLKLQYDNINRRLDHLSSSVAELSTLVTNLQEIVKENFS